MQRSRARLVEEQRRLLKLLPHARARLAHVPSVAHIGLGAKETRGEITDEFAFRVYVHLKLPADEVPRGSLIPDRIAGVPTDVIPAFRPDALADERKVRPLTGGVQLRNEYVEGNDTLLVGTLGCLARSALNLDVLALSCHHVLVAGQGTVGTGVGQPRFVRSCCCCTYNVIGSVSKAVKNADVDCAVVRLDDDIANEVLFDEFGADEVEGIGTLKGAAQAVCMERVRKRGRTTELTTGRVIEVIFEASQIVVAPIAPTLPNAFADRGDSGAVLVNDEDRVVGLLWATDAATRRNGIANHIGPVMRELDLVIGGDANAGLGIPTANC